MFKLRPLWPPPQHCWGSACLCHLFWRPGTDILTAPLGYRSSKLHLGERKERDSIRRRTSSPDGANQLSRLERGEWDTRLWRKKPLTHIPVPNDIVSHTSMWQSEWFRTQVFVKLTFPQNNSNRGLSDIRTVFCPGDWRGRLVEFWIGKLDLSKTFQRQPKQSPFFPPKNCSVHSHMCVSW